MSAYAHKMAGKVALGSFFFFFFPVFNRPSLFLLDAVEMSLLYWKPLKLKTNVEMASQDVFRYCFS